MADPEHAAAPEAFAREFLAQPLGHHSPNLLRLLRRLRAEPIPGKHALLGPVGGRWLLVRCTGDRAMPVELVAGVSFTDPLEAERHVFRLRWQAAFGTPLPEPETAPRAVA